jgi:prepilin-type N-terminal cleavage/methylation domain-containing protein
MLSTLHPRSLRRDDRGFTLIELLITISIMGIISLPLANVVIGYLHNTDATTARLAESHDIQISTAYFQQDVASIGVRSSTYSLVPAAPYPLLQSVETNVAPTAGIYPCGTSGLPNAAVRFAWDDYPSAASGPTSQVRVSYIVETDASGQAQLHRLTCAGSAAILTDTILAHDLVSATASCSTTCTGTGTNVPLTVSLALVVHDPRSVGSAPYTVTLTGQRRQS